MTAVEADFAAKVESAWKGKLDFFQLFDYAGQLEAKQLQPLAVVLYETWLSRNQTPYDHFVQFNLGVARYNQGDLNGAAQAYRQACALSETFLHPHLQLGLVHERLGALQEARAEWNRVVQNARAEDPDQQALRQQALAHLARHPEDPMAPLPAPAAQNLQVRLQFQVTTGLEAAEALSACRQFVREALALRLPPGIETCTVEEAPDGEAPVEPKEQPSPVASPSAPDQGWRARLRSFFSFEGL